MNHCSVYEEVSTGDVVSVQAYQAYSDYYDHHYDEALASVEVVLACNARDRDDVGCDDDGDEEVGYKRDIYIQDKDHILFAYKHCHLQ